MKTKVCHLTSAHSRYDTRIFVKECSSLAQAGYEVSLIVADGLEGETKNNVQIISITSTRGRLSRMWKNVNNILEKALEVDADIYHLHDPELLRIALKLKKEGKKVIFDSHEDVPKQILGKFWIPNLLRRFLSAGFKSYQKRITRQLDGIVAATPYIKNIFEKVNLNTIDICNYPVFDEFKDNPIDSQRNKIVYIGGVSEIRGGTSMVNSMDYIDDTQLHLAGNFIPESYEDTLKDLKGWNHTQFLGYLSRSEVSQLLSESFVGLVVLKPLINYLDALPVKMYEYMAAGVPVVASNFPLWQSIIEGENCGLIVDPLNPKDIAEKIQFLKENPEMAKIMGENGRDAVMHKYNWSIEEAKLIKFYNKLPK